jgi:hypothetical protein
VTRLSARTAAERDTLRLDTEEDRARVDNKPRRRVGGSHAESKEHQMVHSSSAPQTNEEQIIEL